MFSALGDPTRRAILARLAEGDSTVTELAAPHAMSLPAISKHVSVLESAGLVTKARQGRAIRCRLAAAPLRSAGEWIAHYERFWQASFDRLAEYLDHIQD